MANRRRRFRAQWKQNASERGGPGGCDLWGVRGPAAGKLRTGPEAPRPVSADPAAARAAIAVCWPPPPSLSSRSHLGLSPVWRRHPSPNYCHHSIKGGLAAGSSVLAFQRASLTPVSGGIFFFFLGRLQAFSADLLGAQPGLTWGGVSPNTKSS